VFYRLLESTTPTVRLAPGVVGTDGVGSGGGGGVARTELVAKAKTMNTPRMTTVLFIPDTLLTIDSIGLPSPSADHQSPVPTLRIIAQPRPGQLPYDKRTSVSFPWVVTKICSFEFIFRNSNK
jgi:hypothetical protein